MIHTVNCNCTLAPEGCKNCNLNPNSSWWTAPDWSIFNTKDFNDILKEWNDLNIKSAKTYDPEKYDLVEKKDYRIKKLKESIEASKRQLGNNWALLKQLEPKSKEYHANINQCEEDIRRMNQELQELESKKKE